MEYIHFINLDSYIYVPLLNLYKLAGFNLHQCALVHLIKLVRKKRVRERKGMIEIECVCQKKKRKGTCYVCVCVCARARAFEREKERECECEWDESFSIRVIFCLHFCICRAARIECILM